MLKMDSVKSANILVKLVLMILIVIHVVMIPLIDILPLVVFVKMNYQKMDKYVLNVLNLV